MSTNWIEVCCEYDALPAIGHACGHNLIAMSAIATGIGVRAALEASGGGLGGNKIVVLGTPAEEGGGGKIELGLRGAFDDVVVVILAQIASSFVSTLPLLRNARTNNNNLTMSTWHVRCDVLRTAR